MNGDQKNTEIKDSVEFKSTTGTGPSEAPNYKHVIDVTKNEISDLRKEITEFKIKTIEILAIFVALFTFVSANMQVFKSEITFLSAMGFSLIMLGALLIFIYLLHLFIREKSKLSWLLFAIAILLIIIGIFAVSFDYKDYTNKIKNDFYSKNELDQKLIITGNKINLNQESINQNQESLNNFKNCLKTGGWNKCF